MRNRRTPATTHNREVGGSSPPAATHQLPKNVWGHEFAHPRTGASTPARAFLASDYANGQAIHAMVAAVAEKSGIDHAEVEAIIRDAIEKGLAAGVELEATLNVKGK